VGRLLKQRGYTLQREVVPGFVELEVAVPARYLPCGRCRATAKSLDQMTHLLERNHGERYTKFMDDYLPDWRAHRDQLNAAPLPAEDWGLTRGYGNSVDRC
jgi:hypothetical protein